MEKRGPACARPSGFSSAHTAMANSILHCFLNSQPGRIEFGQTSEAPAIPPYLFAPTSSRSDDGRRKLSTVSCPPPAAIVEPTPFVTLLGFLAATFTTISFLPQVLKVWRSGRADDISLGMYGLFCTGIALWLAYGLLTDDLPIIAANIVTLALAGSVLALAIRYRRR